MAGHDAVVHFAAESHVDRSIVGPDDFVNTNCFGTNVVMDTARHLEIGRVVHIGTDEVYGSVEVGLVEGDRPARAALALLGVEGRLRPHRPVLPLDLRHCRSRVTRCTNNFGPYQYPEKAIPLFTTNLLDGQKIPLYGDGLNERDWLYVDDHCAGVHLVLNEGAPGEIYNIGAGNETPNRVLVDKLLALLGAGEEMIDYVDRPARPRPALLGRHRQDHRARLEPGSARSTRRSRRPWRGTATTGGGGNRSRASMQRVLITGAGGQVGRELVGVFADHDVIAVDHHHARRGRPRRRARRGHVDPRPTSSSTARPTPRSTPARPRPTRPGPSTRWRCATSPTGPAGWAPGSATSPPTTSSTAPSPTPYVEWDQPNPVSMYGRSKLGGELELAPGDTIVRTSWVCGFHGGNMVKTILRLAGEHDTLSFVDDQRGHPTFADDLAAVVRRLVVERRPGLFHVTNQGAVSWYEFARAVLDGGRPRPRAGASRSPPPTSMPPRPAPRPANSVLDNAALRLCGVPLAADFHEPLGRLVARLAAS